MHRDGLARLVDDPADVDVAEPLLAAERARDQLAHLAAVEQPLQRQRGVAGRTARREPPGAELEHAVRGAGQPRRVRDQDRRATAHQRLQPVEHRGFAGGVEAAGRLVEDEDRRVAQQRAGDADALALAARQREPLRAEVGVVAQRQRADELVRRRRARGRHDVRARGVGGVGDVVVHRAAEQHRVLEHDRDLLAQPRERAVARVAPVDQHAPGGRVEEARDQRAERRLPGSRRAHQREPLARPDAQRDAAQHRPLGAVAERHVLERDVAGRPRAAVRVRRLGQHVVGGQQLRDPVGLGHRRRDLRQLAREAAHRALRLARVAGEDEQLAGADRAVRDADRADHEDGRGADRLHRADQPVEAGLQPRHGDTRGEPALGALAHAPALVALRSERLDHRHRRQRLRRRSTRCAPPPPAARATACARGAGRRS